MIIRKVQVIYFQEEWVKYFAPIELNPMQSLVLMLNNNNSIRGSCLEPLLKEYGTFTCGNLRRQYRKSVKPAAGENFCTFLSVF